MSQNPIHSDHLIEIDLAQCPTNLQTLFDQSVPGRVRLFSVLEGRHAGIALADDGTHPTWCVVRSAWHGRTFIGGTPNAQCLSQAVTELRRVGQVDLFIESERVSILPLSPAEKRPRLAFYNRADDHQGFETPLRTIPRGCEVRMMDSQILSRCLWRDMMSSIYGSPEHFLANSFGFCLMNGDEILSEAYAGFWGGGEVDIGIITHKEHRGKGYAPIICAHLIQACEQRGYKTYWDCHKSNSASAAVARKLGYRCEQTYTIMRYKPT